MTAGNAIHLHVSLLMKNATSWTVLRVWLVLAWTLPRFCLSNILGCAQAADRFFTEGNSGFIQGSQGDFFRGAKSGEISFYLL